VTTYLRFEDLKDRGIVRHWLTLRRWIEREGFPPGILLGPNTRAWPEEDVERWLASRPIERGSDDAA
jgi:predicted DNA-binding transcriptional regulator AlpA